jgi:4-amino-4-deoxy-L-arabinose transferase-like glycosyltransferase
MGCFAHQRGLASNTEIIANFFIALALYLIVSVGESKALAGFRNLGIGASLGMAFQVNYLSGILLLGVAAFYLYWIADVRPIGALVRRYVRDGAVMLLGFFAVWGICAGAHAGDIRDYFGLSSPTCPAM